MADQRDGGIRVLSVDDDAFLDLVSTHLQRATDRFEVTTDLHSGDRDEVWATGESALEGADPVQFTYRIRTADRRRALMLGAGSLSAVEG